MKLSHFYNQVVRFGASRDPRGKKAKIKRYPDTAILYGDPNTEIHKIMVGIDIEVAELLLAKEVRDREGLDLVLSHHPEGSAYASLHEVMQVQVDILDSLGVPRETAQKLLDERMQEVERRVLPQNHTRPVEAARLLDLPFMCMHTPADNHVFAFINDLLKTKKPKIVQDIVDMLMKVQEYKDAAKFSTGPRIISGNPKRAIGKISVEMTGGTEGSKDVFEKMRKAGVRTLICMHLSEEHLKKVRDADINVVIAGHISSDTLGINLLLDRMEKEEKLEIISCSGFKRIRR